MATTITSADLTVKIIEKVTLNGDNQGATNTLTISGINEIFKQKKIEQANAQSDNMEMERLNGSAKKTN